MEHVKVFNFKEKKPIQYKIFFLGGFCPFSYTFSCHILRSSHQRCSVKKGVLRNFAKFTWKHLCQSLFFNKVAGGACNFIKKETLAQVFSGEFCEISKNNFSQNKSGRLLLHITFVQMFGQGDSSNRQKMNGCSFQ